MISSLDLNTPKAKALRQSGCIAGSILPFNPLSPLPLPIVRTSTNTVHVCLDDESGLLQQRIDNLAHHPAEESVALYAKNEAASPARKNVASNTTVRTNAVIALRHPPPHFPPAFTERRRHIFIRASLFAANQHIPIPVVVPTPRVENGAERRLRLDLSLHHSQVVHLLPHDVRQQDVRRLRQADGVLLLAVVRRHVPLPVVQDRPVREEGQHVQVLPRGRSAEGGVEAGVDRRRRSDRHVCVDAQSVHVLQERRGDLLLHVERHHGRLGRHESVGPAGRGEFDSPSEWIQPDRRGYAL
mmetsp:Transcript_6971/g.20907  ORF Transcript_6971/g.20907 Transcript_6971/m.20907 type:complete len:299 (+) Transcript_6971:327-1223(+)